MSKKSYWTIPLIGILVILIFHVLPDGFARNFLLLVMGGIGVFMAIE